MATITAYNYKVALGDILKIAHFYVCDLFVWSSRHTLLKVHHIINPLFAQPDLLFHLWKIKHNNDIEYSLLYVFNIRKCSILVFSGSC